MTPYEFMATQATAQIDATDPLIQEWLDRMLARMLWRYDQKRIESIESLERCARATEICRNARR